MARQDALLRLHKSLVTRRAEILKKLHDDMHDLAGGVPGSGDSADVPHFLEALNPEDGHVIWRWNSLPKPGQPGSETWPNKEALLHGGARSAEEARGAVLG